MSDLRRWIPFYTAAFLLFVSVASAQAVRSEPLSPIATAMQQQIDAWVHELSKQETFYAWQHAERTITAFGPGTHGWLVTFVHNAQPAGYMLVHAVQDGGYQLGEYGLGAEPLYSDSVLKRALLNLEQNEINEEALFIEQRYASPLLAVWRVNQDSMDPVYLDAKTGDQLPLDDPSWTTALNHTNDEANVRTAGQNQITQSLLLPVFDVFERMPWLSQAPLPMSFSILVDKLLQQQPIWYTSSPFQGAHLFVWPVTGFHLWSDDIPYIAVDQEGSRFIPYDYLAAHGHYYD